MTSTITRGFFEDSEIHNKGPAQIAFDLDALSESDYGLTLGHSSLNVSSRPGQAIRRSMCPRRFLQARPGHSLLNVPVALPPGRARPGPRRFLQVRPGQLTLNPPAALPLVAGQFGLPVSRVRSCRPRPTCPCAPPLPVCSGRPSSGSPQLESRSLRARPVCLGPQAPRAHSASNGLARPGGSAAGTFQRQMAWRDPEEAPRAHSASNGLARSGGSAAGTFTVNLT